MSLLQDSNVPSVFIDLLISDLYNLNDPTSEESAMNSPATIDSADEKSSSFSVPLCLEISRFILLSERLLIDRQPLIAHFAEHYAKKANLEQVTDILHRLFSSSPFDLSDETTTKTSPTDLYCMQSGSTFLALVNTLLPAARESKSDFLKLLNSIELTKRAIGLEGLAPLVALVQLPATPEVDVSATFPSARVTGLEWRLPSEIILLPAPAATSEAPQTSEVVRPQVDMIATGKNVLSAVDALPSDFAVGIQGSGSRFMIAQDWLLFSRWAYFERLARDAKFEIRDRVFVLPSDFPIDLLEIVLMLIHGFPQNQVQKAIKGLYDSDNEYLFVRGAEFGLFDDLLANPSPNDVFEPLQSHVLTYEEEEDGEDDDEFNAPLFPFNTAQSENAAGSGPFTGFFGQAEPPYKSNDECSVMVSNLVAGASDDLIQRYFGPFGDILSIRWSRAVFNMQFAIIEFSTVEAKRAALSLSGSDIDGRMIVVSEVNVFGFGS